MLTEFFFIKINYYPVRSIWQRLLLSAVETVRGIGGTHRIAYMFLSTEENNDKERVQYVRHVYCSLPNPR